MEKKIKRVPSMDIQDTSRRVAHIILNPSDKEVGLEPPDAVDEDAHDFWDADAKETLPICSDAVYQPTDVLAVAADSAPPTTDVEVQMTVPLPTKVTQVQDEAPLPAVVTGVQEELSSTMVVGVRDEAATVNNDFEEASPPVIACLVEPQLSARDILQAIHDLGSKFDLLATNDRVDALEARVGGMEQVIGQRLATLEKRMNASDAQWKAMSLSVGHLSNGIQKHADNLLAHRPRPNNTMYAPPRHHHTNLPTWLAYNVACDEDSGSILGRQWTHAWDLSVVTGAEGHVRTSLSAVQMVNVPPMPVTQANSFASSSLSSPILVISKK
ncbi:hypothetical protein EDD22DRAFT_850284 [Suillus occidentalis]|nr:hypothetical protein EDD22DRAFT_850284 [Suillus occidentalis]